MPTAAASGPFPCDACGGGGARLPAAHVYCPRCRWLRPLAPGYAMDPNVFLWRLDADAMNTLQSIAPLRTAAHQLSERYGRPWFEAAISGVRLSERQLPDVFRQAVFAARVVGLPYLPELYVSGDEMWGAKTLGSDAGSFVALGSVLLNFRGDDLLFLLGREMGHVAAGHALWKTVVEFLSGRRPAQRTIMGDGVLQFLNPAKLVESAVEAPLMAWARHAEITADRAGLLVAGREDVAQRVLLQWTLKSFPLYNRLNLEAWREQEEEGDDGTLRLSEMTMGSTPYLAPRLKLMRAFAASDTFRGWRDVITYWQQQAPAPPAADARPDPAAPRKAPAPDAVRLVCTACKQPLRIARAVLQGAGPVKVRCPNAACRKVLEVKPKAPAAPAPETLTTD